MNLADIQKNPDEFKRQVEESIDFASDFVIVNGVIIRKDHSQIIKDCYE